MYLLKNFITIEDLEIRWRCDKELIESFTYGNADEPHMIKYVSTEIRTRPDGGGKQPLQKLLGTLMAAFLIWQTY